MTHRRWLADEEDKDAVGPIEQAARAELEKIGFTPLTPPGPLRTNAERALALAETYDRSMNSGALPALDRCFKEAMADARAATEESILPTPERVADPEVSDFEARRRKRHGEESA